MLISSHLLDMNLLHRVVRLPLRMIPPEKVVSIVKGPLRGQRWIVGSNVHGCWLGTYERRTVEAFSAAIQPGDTVYDLGANVGLYSLLAGLRTGPTGKVVSFEPVPRNLHYLRRHLDLNGIRNCSIWDAAVGNSNGTASFDETSDCRTGHLVAGSTGTLTVKTVRLDTLLATGKIPPPDILKCDIEGGEFDALSGAAGILATYRPKIFLETHSPEQFQHCCRRLSDLCYRLTISDHPFSRQVHEVIAEPM